MTLTIDKETEEEKVIGNRFGEAVVDTYEVDKETVELLQGTAGERKE